jgi:hypothetical protein
MVRTSILSRMVILAGVALVPACALLGTGAKTLGVNTGLFEYPGKNPSATRSYLASLDFSQTDSIVDTSLPCHDASDCSGGSIHLRIVPEKNAYRVPVDQALKAGRGYIVARIENHSQSIYKSLNLLANETAYLWVGEMPSGPRRIAIFYVDPASGQATWRSTATRAGWCAPPAGMTRTISAVHLNAMPQCSATNPLYSAQMQGIGLKNIQLASTSSSILGDALTKSMAHRGGLWFSCSLGCCEGSDIEQAPE